MWNPGWDKLFERKAWGKYPALEVIRFVARNFYGAPDRKAVRLLDLGCGVGANLIYLAGEGFAACGVDGSAVALKQARSRLATAGLEADLRQSDVMQLPFDEASFDGVIDFECLYANSKADSRRILSEVSRVLKPGGLFLSVTFMTGTHGDGLGPKLEGEPHTYTRIDAPSFNAGYGIIRLTSDAEIPELYGQFEILAVDYMARSEGSRAYEVKEWVIQCRKPAGPGTS